MAIGPFEEKKSLPPGPPPFPWLPLFLALGFIGLFALSNASVLKLTEIYDPQDWGAFWVYLTAGGMCAQLGLLTIWGAVGVGKSWHRQLSVLAVGSIWLASWFSGPSLFETQFKINSWREAAPALCLPILLLATQLPLWIFRVLARWRLAYDDPAIPSRPPQMSIAGILGAMTLVGISLALVRLGLRVGEIFDDSEWWIAVSITGASCSLASLIILTPVCVLLLRMYSWLAGFLLSLLYLSGAAVLVWMTAFTIMGDFGGGPFRTYMALPTTFCGFAFGLLLPLVLLRLANYRLRWGRE